MEVLFLGNFFGERFLVEVFGGSPSSFLFL